MYSRSTIVSIGEHRGSPRLYLEGKWLGKAGFEPGENIRVDFKTNKVSIMPDDLGDRVVSSKRKNTIPIIDINCQELADIFDNAKSVQVVAGNNEITITPAYTATLRATRELEVACSVWQQSSVALNRRLL